MQRPAKRSPLRLPASTLRRAYSRLGMAPLTSARANSPKSGICHVANLCYTACMSVVEAAIEKVKQLDEAHARRLLTWLQGQERAAAPARPPAGAMAMLGFARRFRPAPRA